MISGGNEADEPLGKGPYGVSGAGDELGSGDMSHAEPLGLLERDEMLRRARKRCGITRPC